MRRYGEVLRVPHVAALIAATLIARFPIGINALAVILYLLPLPGWAEPVQVRIGILNQLSPEQISEITGRFADAMLAMGAEFDKAKVMNGLKSYYAKAA